MSFDVSKLNPNLYQNMYAQTGAMTTGAVPKDGEGFGLKGAQVETGVNSIGVKQPGAFVSDPTVSSTSIISSMEKIDNTVLKPACASDVLGKNIDFYG